VYDIRDNTILLVRNHGQDWWYMPGGEWNYAEEDICECVKREVFEETGIHVNIVKFGYVQNIFMKEKNSIWLELFWLAVPVDKKQILITHIDEFGLVAEAKWFNKTEILQIKIYPEIIKQIFWKDVESILNETDRYIGFFSI